MNSMQVVLQGWLNPDGSLELSAKPPLPVGAVEVTIRSLAPDATHQDWWQYLQRARSELESSGHRFRTKDEIDSEIEALRAQLALLEETGMAIRTSKVR